MVELSNKKSSTEKEEVKSDKSAIRDHGSSYHSLHSNVPGIYFIKTGRIEMVLKVVSSSFLCTNYLLFQLKYEPNHTEYYLNDFQVLQAVKEAGHGGKSKEPQQCISSH